MLFNSLAFVAFFLVVFGVYYLPVVRRFQIQLLLIASAVFYAWEMPSLLLLLGFSVLLNSITSFQVAKSERPKQIKWATFGIVANLTLLSVFKYGALLAHTVADLGKAHVDPAFLLFHIPLPIGISFYTFEGISLLVDALAGSGQVGTVDLKSLKFTDHLKQTALFIAFFPHLIAGPILKARQFYPQIGPKNFRDINWDRAISCLIIGYFLKVVVADNLHDFSFWIQYPVFEVESSITLVFLLFGYSIQIFSDFAGYSLIAIGVAAVLGYNLPDNFNFPYVSRSISEFWRRWHISLSTWLRDYLYFPLGGNRRGALRTYLNLMVVMILGGLWHGAALSFAVWGAYHGVGLAAERWISDLRGRRGDVNDATTWPGLIADLGRAFLVFGFVSLGWLLFKLQHFSHVLAFLSSLRTNIHLRPDPMMILPVIIYTFPVVIYHAMHFPGLRELFARSAAKPVADHPAPVANAVRLPAMVAQFIYAAMLALIVVNYGSTNAFIYFQF